MGGLGTLLIVAFLLLLNIRQKKKANQLLQTQKEQIDAKAHELEAQKENLEQSYRNVELLGEIGRKITSSLSVETIISTVYDNVNSLMDAAVFGIGIYHEESKTIDFPATYENGQALPAYSNSIYDQNRFAGLCFISGKEISIGDLSTEYSNYLQHLRNPIAGDQPASLIYLPLKVKEKMLGVITVQSFKKNAFSDYQLFMLRTIAVYASIALENAEAFRNLNITVDSLQKTQKQLVQSEKMASLGELTAGIAHEIQNPLNFINNFSEVNRELIGEMREEIEKGNYNEAKVIGQNIATNQEKINHHGRRADGIVKGMLQQSRAGSGQKELTDINALAEEFLRLAYHGLRARDKNFNVRSQTDLDSHVGKVNIVQQDIGRVILNLINNAFYAVSEKQRLLANVHLPDGQSYEPMVTVKSKQVNGKIELSVIDNGNGVPQKVLDKIFQPFFTTKPPGQGTGLGLSLAYDIVKAHGGEIKVNTKEGEFSEFFIQLPISA
jgi:signal transduction histidine kinase